MKFTGKEYGRISACLGMLLIFASGANAQAKNPDAPPFPVSPNARKLTEAEGKGNLLQLPAGIENLVFIDPAERNLVVGTPEPVASGATLGAPNYEPIESLVSVEAHMILLARTKTQTHIFVPQHLSPNVWARLFGGIIIPTREFVAPSQ